MQDFFDQEPNRFDRQIPWEQDHPSYPKKEGSRGLLVFSVAMLLLAAFCLFGSFQLRRSSEIRTPSLPQQEQRETQEAPSYPQTGSSQRDTDMEPLFGKDDAPELTLYSRADSALFGVQESGLSIPMIAERVSPAVVGVVADGHSQTAYGSGILISENGYLVTNAHVIEQGEELSVILHDGSEYAAQIVGSDRQTDLAVLKIDAQELPFAVFGDSSELVVGELAVAIGNPMSMELFGSVTAGVISALDRQIVMEDRTMVLLQTDAAINPGNSGGALVNGYGQVIGINSVKVMSNSYEGIGFAIPSASAKPVIDALIAYGYVPGRPAIGIVGEDVSIYYSTYGNVPRGVYVHGVTEGTDAVGKGLRVGDIIIAIDGTPVSGMAELNRLKGLHSAGETVTLTLWRDGTQFDVTIRLTEVQRP
ncbi:MAG: trypsin-like peptidase domain-containing protein [Clostridia bacterium]|nr:trypsin-like peptidase domain-containing protein [Clostridia bacterium]